MALGIMKKHLLHFTYDFSMKINNIKSAFSVPGYVKIYLNFSHEQMFFILSTGIKIKACSSISLFCCNL